LYTAILNKLLAQRGKKIDTATADILIGDIQYLIGTCNAQAPIATNPPSGGNFDGGIVGTPIVVVVGSADAGSGPAGGGPVLRYHLPSPGPVRVRVFDVTGRLAADLVNDYQGAGQHDVSLAGAAHGAGIFFYRVEWEGQTLRGRFVAAR